MKTSSWGLVGRDDELAAGRWALRRAGSSGVVLVGASGAGTTRLARELVDAATGWGDRTAWVVGTRAAASVPLGAFAPLLPAELPGRSPVEQLTAASAAIVALGGGRLVVGIDDAHLLDDASAALAHQLILAGGCRLVVTITRGQPAPDAVAAITRDPRLTRIELEPLSHEAMAQLLDAAVGGPVERHAARHLLGLADGNPLVLHEALLGAQETGALVEVGGRWVRRGELTRSRRITDLMEQRLAHLDDGAREALELLALGEPLGVASLIDLVGGGVVDALEADGLLAVRRHGRRVDAHLAHPLYAAVLRARLPQGRARSSYRRLAEAVTVRGQRRWEDLLRVATWRLDAGEPDAPAVLVDAARRALALSDVPLATRLARAAMAAEPCIDAAVALSDALVADGAFDEALALLDSGTAQPDGDAERAALALARSHALAAGDGEPDAAVAVLRAAEAEIADPAWAAELAAARAHVLADAGAFEAALAAAAALPASGISPRARVTALVVVTLAHTLLGRTGAALADIEAGLAAAAEAHGRPNPSMSHPEVTLRLHRVYALALHGRLTAAEDAAREGVDAAGDLAGDLLGPWLLTLAYVLVARGQCTEARDILDEATELAAARDPFSILPACTALAALAAALGGDVAEAEALLAEIDRAGPRGMDRHTVWAARARAWVAIQRRDTAAAAGHALHAAAFGDATGPTAWGVEALHDLVRFGRPELAVDELDGLAGRMDGVRVQAMADHARALAAGDPDALVVVAEAFTGMGAELHAAETAFQAAEAFRSQQRADEARQATSRATTAARRCTGAATPALTPDRKPLTPREEEVAQLAALRLTSPEIAERLGVSVRTVDNLLYRAYHKLGVHDRRDLADALG